MAEDKPVTRKTTAKKATTKPPVKKSAAAKKTETVKKTAIKSAAPKKAPSTKKAATKKAPVKKSTVTKSTAQQAVMEKADEIRAASRRAADKEILGTIKSIVSEMRQESDSRDKQMKMLVNEIHQGFKSYAEHTSAKVSAQDREMDKLHVSLQSAFSNAEDSSKNSEHRSMQILEALSESIMMDHEQTLKEVQEQKKLQDEQIDHLTKMEEKRTSRSRWLSVPGILLAIIAIIYMFHVVNVMEGAMTNMSGDMDEMQQAVTIMSEKMVTMADDTHIMQGGVTNMSNLMGGMAADTNTMSTDMNQLNKNLTQMSYDLNIMTRNVSPTMKGIHDMMPWSP